MLLYVASIWASDWSENKTEKGREFTGYMSENTSIKKNLGFQTAYQILITCLPLITSPYLSRVLGASQLGVYSFTSSIMSYFALFALLGTVNHGTRSIAL